MQLLLLALVLGIFLHDAAVSPGAAPAADGAVLLALMFLPRLGLLGTLWLASRTTLRSLGRAGGQRAMLRLDRFSGLYRAGAIGLYALELHLGSLRWLRSLTGDLVLLDELVFLAPTLGMLAAVWVFYYPIERRIREASLMGRLDTGRPIYPLLTRGQYVLSQVRHQMALILVPLLMIMTWSQLVERYVAPHWRLFGHDPQPMLMVAGAAGIFLLAPLIMRHVWDTAPLPAGELRDRLVAMCHRHRVGVRELLLWRTFGGMINAAVMGLVPRLRYILLTDALLEMVRREQVEAVMAHELAHVRRHHMFWLLAAALGALGVLELVYLALFTTIAGYLPAAPAESGPMIVHAGWAGDAWAMLATALATLASPQALVGATLAAAGASWVAIFGWVSRRIERQADTFAVQHLAGEREQPARDAAGRLLVDVESVQTMVAALQAVADLNHIPPERRSWRHGSIVWRQRYLRRLVGERVDRLPIDRQMRWIKLASAAAVLVVVAAYAMVGV
ncbi:MAG: M48 family metallopeptidase [Phycisphaeraceae bacterium]